MSIPEMLGDYRLIEKLCERKGAVEYRARTADELPVLLKVLNPRWCRPRDVDRLKNEYELQRELDTPAAVRALAFGTYEGMPALVTEDLGGDSLERRREPMPVDQFLSLAVRMATATQEIHARGLVHRDLRPENFIVDPRGGVHITGFGIASRLSREQMPLRSSAALVEDSLPYMSPEQTGRMNRPVDSRSDLYSLGVTFYQMLAARLPFVAEDLIGWVHSHMARTPGPVPAHLVPPGAGIVWNIVLKLLAKVPEDRYQGAAGLRHDLERCRDEWEKLGRIEAFSLGSRDFSDHLIIPRKLYGREAEASAMLAAFERVSATGVPELLLVSGSPGVGKSSLVQTLQEPIVRRQGFFASGKYEKQKSDIPFVAKPARELIHDILAESPARVAEWKEHVQRSLGNGGQVIVDLIPEIELLVGPQPPVPELQPSEAEARLQYLFRSLVGVFTSPEHPLTVFFDDLQWADPASLRLLQHVLSHPDTHHLLVIGAYRDSEVSASHPLALAMEQTRKAGGMVTDLALRPLSVVHVGQLVADTVRCEHEESADLARLLHEKTGGNPFFAIQFLAELERRRLVVLDWSTGRWRWDIPSIAAESFTDNVAQLMAQRLNLLPPATREVLRLCACIGSVVEESLLAEVVGRNKPEIDLALQPALDEDLLVGSEGAFRFAHDRVHEAAYSLLPEEERSAAHLRVGRALLSRTPAGKVEENVFAIVNQLDRGATLIGSREERDRLAELNLLAGKRARLSGAYASGVQFFSSGAALLGGDSWDRRHDLVFALELGRAECQYLSGNRDAAERALSILARRARDNMEALAAARVKINLHMSQTLPEKAIEAGIELLHRVGLELTAHPSHAQVAQEYARTWQNLGGRQIEDLVDLPRMTDPTWRGTMEVLLAMEVPAIVTDPNLYCLIPCLMVQISVVHGNTDASCYAYEGMGGVVGPVLGDYPRGIRFAELGRTLVERHELSRYRAMVDTTFGSSIDIWRRHVRSSVNLLARAFEEGIEDGALNEACYATCQQIAARIFSGEPLDDILHATETGRDFARRAGVDFAANIILSQQRLVLGLQGKSERFGSLSGAEFDEERFEANLAEAGPRMAAATCFYFIWKLQARMMARDCAGALGAASKARELDWTSLVFLQRVELVFYEALAAAALHDEAGASAKQKAACRETLAAQQKQLGIWAETCPENFRDRHALVSAEIARIDADPLRAEELYEVAIQAARKSGFVHSEGLAYETASLFYRARAFPIIADAYLREARACYLRWGADGKVREIDRLHPRPLQTQPSVPVSVDVMRSEQLDLLAVVRASQAISREIDQETLLRTLLRVVLEHGEARAARLILVRDGELRLEGKAEATCNGGSGEMVHTRLLGSALVTSSSPLPVSVLHYVRRTRERVLLDDAQADAGRFAGDAYFARTNTRSLLCLPVLRQDQAIALLILENDLAPGVFTGGRLGALDLLATQAAISIENARLMHEAQESIRARDIFLSLASHELRTPVTALLLMVRRLRGGNLKSGTETMQRATVLLDRQLGRLRTLIDDMMFVGQILVGRLELHATPMDLAALVRDEVERSAAAFQSAKCAVTLRADRPVRGRWDRDKLAQVASKLLANALKFGAGAPIEIEVDEIGGSARLVVADHGIGIDVEALPHIFERFTRAVSPTLYGGLGIGLYIVQNIVQASGGTLRAESMPHVETRFTVELPTGRHVDA